MARLLDLTDRGVRRKLGFTLGELMEEDWEAIQEEGEESWTQAIGRAASQIGFEGLRVPSARDRPHGVNIVLFENHLDSTNSVELAPSSQLPEHP